MSSIQDITEFARKGAMLLVIPPLTILLSDNKIRQLSLASLVLGFIASACYVFIQAIEYGWHGQRITGFLDIGRWTEMTAYLICFFLPFLYSKRTSLIILSSSLFILGIVVLVLGGGRAPILAILLLLPIYIFIKNKSHCIMLACGALLAVMVVSAYSPKHFEGIADRIVSIVNINTDYSNVARLTMWKTSFDFFSHNLVSDPYIAIFGTGSFSFSHRYTTYLTSLHPKEYYLEKTFSQFSFNDSHNMYLDMLNKNGLLFTSIWISCALALVINLYKLNKNEEASVVGESSFLVLLCFLIIGFFYTSNMNHQTSFIYLAISLATSSRLVKNK